MSRLRHQLRTPGNATRSANALRRRKQAGQAFGVMQHDALARHPATQPPQRAPAPCVICFDAGYCVRNSARATGSLFKSRPCTNWVPSTGRFFGADIEIISNLPQLRATPRRQTKPKASVVGCSRRLRNLKNCRRVGFIYLLKTDFEIYLFIIRSVIVRIGVVFRGSHGEGAMMRERRERRERFEREE